MNLGKKGPRDTRDLRGGHSVCRGCLRHCEGVDQLSGQNTLPAECAGDCKRGRVDMCSFFLPFRSPFPTQAFPPPPPAPLPSRVSDSSVDVIIPRVENLGARTRRYTIPPPMRPGFEVGKSVRGSSRKTVRFVEGLEQERARSHKRRTFTEEEEAAILFRLRAAR